MPDLTVSHFTGIDRRRSQVAALAGALWECTNAHINDGGEVEQNKKFVSTYTLPSGSGYTFGLASNGVTLYTFGSPADPGTVPAGVTYQRLQHPGVGVMTAVLSVTLFSENLYAIAQFNDGSIYDYYNGTRLTDWFDGKARGSFDITAGTAGAGVNMVTSVKVNGVEVMNVSVDWTTDHATTAAAIAAQINTYASTPEYTATSSGPTVFVIAPTGASSNGYSIAVTTAGTVTASTPVDLAGGQDNSPGNQGATALTLKDKLYTVASKNVNFSALRDATHFNSDYVGAGFFQPSTHSAGSGLVALSTHAANLVIFMKNVAQLWFVDADDENNQQIQILEGAGTTAPKGPIEFDSATYFLGIKGIRALSPRPYAQSGAVDITNKGAPIDKIVLANIAALSTTVRDAAVSVVEPRENRLWFVVGQDIYVLSAYPEAKIFAWSLYQPGFQITDFATIREKLYCRAADTVYLYGGAAFDQLSTTLTTTVRIPYLDAGRPAGFKDLDGIDLAVVGTWKVEMSTDPNDPNSLETVANVSQSTFETETIPAAGRTTHIAVVLTHTGAGATPASISEFVLHYLTDTDA